MENSSCCSKLKEQLKESELTCQRLFEKLQKFQKRNDELENYIAQLEHKLTPLKEPDDQLLNRLEILMENYENPNYNQQQILLNIIEIMSVGFMNSLGNKSQFKSENLMKNIRQSLDKLTSKIKSPPIQPAIKGLP